MSTTFTTWLTPLCYTLKTQALLLLFLGLSSHTLFSQQADLLCNDRTPWVNGTFTVTESHSSVGLACWEGDVDCPGGSVPANVINSSLSDFATGNMDLMGSLTLRVSDLSNIYAAGNFAGFVVESGLISTGLFSSITISTYLNGTLQETNLAIDLVTLNSSLFSDPFPVGFITALDFNEIQIEIDDALGEGTYNVYYAFMERYCEGPGLTECNTQVAMNRPVYPVRIDYENTGSSGISAGNVDDPENAISASTTDFASLINLAGVFGSTFLTVEEQVTNYPAGTYVGFDIENLTLLGAGFLNYITVTSYLDGVQQEEFSGPDLLAGAPLLSGSGRHTVGFVTSTAVDKVKITIEQPAGVTLGTTSVYSAIFQMLCAGIPPECNSLSAITSPSFPVYIDVEHTGLSGAGCAGCSVIDEGNVIDEDSSNYAQVILTAGTLVSGSLSVHDAITTYDATTFVGFRIENETLVDADALMGITIETYLDGTLQESETNLGALLSIGSDLLVNEDQQVVGFVTSAQFDEVRIILSNVATLDLGTTRIFELVMQPFCAATIECSNTYFLNSPAFPVYIDAFRTGIDGVACVLCTVDNVQAVITADTSDYATILVPADVASSASIAVADALYTYAEGTFAGFVIEDLGFLLEAELFESLTISTYNDGVLQESRSGVDLNDLEVIISFISEGEGRYNVGFETTLAFDEIQISVGSLVSVDNGVRVYSAFVDTRTSYGEGLECVAGPVALDDVAETDEEISVTIDVLINDIPGDSFIGPPVVIDSTNNGDLVVNPDSTITYTPDSNFVGVDTFTYAICNDSIPPLCDTAQVIVTVHPVLDTIYETIPEDSFLVVCAGDLTIFNEAADTIFVCGSSSNGTLIPDMDCITYEPDPDFTGQDTFCLVVCHPDDSLLCDTTIVIITVTPVNDPPDAVDDTAATEINTEVIIDVLENDSDPDSPLGEPMIDDLPMNGTVVVNPDSTITYTPNEDFSGVDTFTYFICDAGIPVYCDTATVIITVMPIRDTISVEIAVDSTLEICVSFMTELNNPVLMTVCDSPSHGTIIIIDTCFQLIAEIGFEGRDTMCVVICDSLGPCDTATIIVVREIILPVQLVYFDVRKTGNSSMLTWKTAFEYNTDYFEIQRAGEDNMFSPIGMVESAGSSSSERIYDYTDESPYAGVSYYRLLMMDIDGKSSLSPIRSVSFNEGHLQMRLWPNPAQSELNIETQGGIAEPGSLRIIDSDGRVVMEQSYQSNHQMTIDLGRVVPGLYTIVMQSAHNYSTEKLVVFR